MTDLSWLPRPILDSRPGWIDLYWRAWAAFAPPPGWTPAHLARSLSASADEPDPCSSPVRDRASAMYPYEAAQAQLDEWCVRFPPSSAPPPDLAPEVTALLLAQIIGIQLQRVEAADGPERQILWQLREPPPVGVHNLTWDDYTISLLADHPQGGGLRVQVDSPVALLLEIVTPYTTFVEVVAPGPQTLTLTVLDRTDVQ